MQERQSGETRRQWQRPGPPVILHNTATEGAGGGSVDENGHITAYSTGLHVAGSGNPVFASNSSAGLSGAGGGS